MFASCYNIREVLATAVGGQLLPHKGGERYERNECDVVAFRRFSRALKKKVTALSYQLTAVTMLK